MGEATVKTRIVCLTAMMMAAAGSLGAQQGTWALGFGGGGSFYFDKSFTAPPGSAEAGFESSFALGAWLTQDLYGKVGGEIRYAFQQNGLRLKAGGETVTMDGRSHAIAYSLQFHFTDRGSSVRPYIAVGGGVKQYAGTGTESATQPLQDYAILTRTSEWKPLVVFGAGVKFRAGDHVRFHVEVLDYTTPFPKEVILPAPGADLGGWIHNLTPMAGISFIF